MSPWMMKLSGTVMREADRCPGVVPRVPGSAWAGRPRCSERWWSGCSDSVPRSDGEARVLVGVECVAERVEDIGAELDRVGAAELLEREADLELGRRSRWSVADRRDRDLRRDVERPVVERAGDSRRGVGELERPDAGDPQVERFLKSTVWPIRAREQARGPERPGEGGRARGDRVRGRVVQDGVDEVRAGAAHAREQGNLRPVGRDQDRGEVRIRSRRRR